MVHHEQESHCANILSWMTQRPFRRDLFYKIFPAPTLQMCRKCTCDLCLSAVLTNFNEETRFILENVQVKKQQQS